MLNHAAAHSVRAGVSKSINSGAEWLRRITALRVLEARERFARDRALGQTFENEIVDLTALCEIASGLDAVVGETRAGPDAYRGFQSTPSFTSCSNSDSDNPSQLTNTSRPSAPSLLLGLSGMSGTPS